MFLNTFYPWPPFPYFLKVDFFIAIRQKKCLFNFSLTKREGNNNQRDSNRLFCNWNKEPDKEQRCTQGGMGGGGDPDSFALQKFNHQDLSKNAEKIGQKGRSPHFREFEGSVPKLFPRYAHVHPHGVLDTPLPRKINICPENWQDRHLLSEKRWDIFTLVSSSHWPNSE